MPVSRDVSTAKVHAEIDIQTASFLPEASSRSMYDSVLRLDDGVWVMRGAQDTSSHKFSVLSTEPALAKETYRSDWFYQNHQPPRTELLLTVSMVMGSQFMARTSHTYYVTDEAGYRGKVIQPMSVVKESVAAPAPTPACDGCQPVPRRVIKVEGDCPLESGCVASQWDELNVRPKSVRR